MDLWQMLGVNPRMGLALAAGGCVLACLFGLSRLRRRKGHSEVLGLGGSD